MPLSTSSIRVIAFRQKLGAVFINDWAELALLDLLKQEFRSLLLNFLSDLVSVLEELGFTAGDHLGDIVNLWLESVTILIS